MSYKEPQWLNSVKKFHDLFNAYVWDAPAIPTKEMAEFRIRLLQEELDELKEAVANDDLVEAADALTDIQYVLSWAVLAFGMQNIFNELFEEVQFSNMSKACKTLEEAEATVTYYQTERDTEWYIKQQWELFLVYRKSDDKVLKSVKYHPANLESIITQSKNA